MYHMFLVTWSQVLWFLLYWHETGSFGGVAHHTGACVSLDLERLLLQLLNSNSRGFPGAQRAHLRCEQHSLPRPRCYLRAQPTGRTQKDTTRECHVQATGEHAEQTNCASRIWQTRSMRQSRTCKATYFCLQQQANQMVKDDLAGQLASALSTCSSQAVPAVSLLLGDTQTLS